MTASPEAGVLDSEALRRSEQGVADRVEGGADSSEGILMMAERFWVLLDGNGPPRCRSAIGADDCRRSRRRYPIAPLTRIRTRRSIAWSEIP
jgi:hypothetical protein